jgi:dolichol-phosphate mannosyltransferase
MQPRSSSVRALVVLPTYNEVDNVGPLTEALLYHATEAEILIIDDSSPDGTADRVQELQRSEPRIYLLRRLRKLGLGSAYLAGFEFGIERGHAVLVMMDADLSHDPSHLPEMLEASSDHPLVIGSRYVEGGGIRNWPWHRRFLSDVANRYARTLLGLDVRDCTSGYRCYHRQAIEAARTFNIRSFGYSFLYEMLARISAAEFSVVEVSVVYEERKAGKSKINSSEIFVACGAC